MFRTDLEKEDENLYKYNRNVKGIDRLKPTYLQNKLR